MSTTYIKGRYGETTCNLTEIDESRWRFETVDEYYRLGFTDGEEGLSFVDPSGGPFIDIGTNLRDLDRRLPNQTVTGILNTEEGIVLAVE